MSATDGNTEIDYRALWLWERKRVEVLSALFPWLYHAPGCATNCHQDSCITPHECDCGLTEAFERAKS